MFHDDQEKTHAEWVCACAAGLRLLLQQGLALPSPRSGLPMGLALQLPAKNVYLGEMDRPHFLSFLK